MKKLVLITICSIIFLAGCSSTPPHSEKPVVKVSEEEKADSSDTPEEVVEEENTVSGEIVPVTKEEFDSKFKRDPEETQYEDGKTELKDKTILNVDEIIYSNGEAFDYLIATYHENKLVHLQVETSISTEEALSGLGLSQKNYSRIKPSAHTSGIFDVVIDERFADENIAVFPSEWGSL